jgi:hypothetical protein
MADAQEPQRSDALTRCGTRTVAINDTNGVGFLGDFAQLLATIAAARYTRSLKRTARCGRWN